MARFIVCVKLLCLMMISDWWCVCVKLLCLMIDDWWLMIDNWWLNTRIVANDRYDSLWNYWWMAIDDQWQDLLCVCEIVMIDEW
jgi:hypothetical protein